MRLSNLNKEDDPLHSLYFTKKKRPRSIKEMASTILVATLMLLSDTTYGMNSCS